MPGKVQGILNSGNPLSWQTAHISVTDRVKRVVPTVHTPVRLCNFQALILKKLDHQLTTNCCECNLCSIPVVNRLSLGLLLM